MVHTLTNYNGVKIVTPENDLSTDRQALNDNFEFLADNCVRNPMKSSLDGGGFQITDLGILVSAASFDGVSAYASVPHKSAFNAMPLSISFWMQTTQSGFWDLLSTQAADNSFGWRVETPDQPCLIYDLMSIAQVSSTINDGRWHHVVFTIDGGGNVQSYLDGAAQTTGTVSLNDVSSDFQIGAALDLSRYYAGLMNELILFNIELTPDQVTAIYNSGLGVSGITGVPGLSLADLIAGYHMDGDFSDFSGNGNNGTNHGASFVDNVSRGLALSAIGYTSLDNGAIESDGSGNLTVASLTATATLSPTSALTPGVTGQITWDGSNIYVCTNGGPAGSATWMAAALAPV